MIFLADVGNTNVVFAGFDAKGARFSFRTATPKTPEAGAALGAEVAQKLAAASGADATFAGAVLCSVVPQADAAVLGALRTASGQEPLVLSCRGNTGIDIPIGDPAELGNDLLAAAIAVKNRYPLPAIVADLGTATTFTPQNAQGAVLGVAICPGVALGLHALAGGASQLCEVGLQPPQKAIGTDTPSSLQSGVVLGAAALLDGMTQRIAQEFGQPMQLIVTGGLSPLILPFCQTPALCVADLVLEGMYDYYKQNKPAG